MKKLFLVLALVAFATSAYAANCKVNGTTTVYCRWDSGCWTLNDTDNTGTVIGCSTQAGYCPQLYTGGREGSGDCTGTPLDCSGGCSWTEEATINCYYKESECWPKTQAECEATYGTVVADCGNPGISTIYCTYGPCVGGDGYDCADGGCYAKPGATECETYSTQVTQCACEDLPPAGKADRPDCGGGSPIITIGQATGNALIAMHNAVNLQITGMAVFSIYDMKGKAVRTQRIWQSGSHLVSLQELPRGLYVVQAASGSWKQTIKVTVK